MNPDFVTAIVLLLIIIGIAGALISCLVRHIINFRESRRRQRFLTERSELSHFIDSLPHDEPEDDDMDFDVDDDKDVYDEPEEDENIDFDVPYSRPRRKKPKHVSNLRVGELTVNPDAPDNFFKGKSVVFTGDIPWIERVEAAQALSNLGALVKSSISSKTQIVIIGNQPGPSKMAKVDELRASGRDVRIMLQWEFAREVRAVFDACPGARHCPYEIDNDFIVS